MSPQKAIREFPQTPLARWLSLIVSGLLLPAMLMAGVWGATLDKRLTKIESNRFTSMDASALQITLAKKDAEILALIAQMQKQVAVSGAHIDQLKKDLDRLQERVDQWRD